MARKKTKKQAPQCIFYFFYINIQHRITALKFCNENTANIKSLRVQLGCIYIHVLEGSSFNLYFTMRTWFSNEGRGLSI